MDGVNPQVFVFSLVKCLQLTLSVYFSKTRENFFRCKYFYDFSFLFFATEELPPCHDSGTCAALWLAAGGGTGLWLAGAGSWHRGVQCDAARDAASLMRSDITHLSYTEQQAEAETWSLKLGQTFGLQIYSWRLCDKYFWPVCIFRYFNVWHRMLIWRLKFSPLAVTSVTVTHSPICVSLLPLRSHLTPESDNVGFLWILDISSKLHHQI